VCASFGVGRRFVFCTWRAFAAIYKAGLAGVGRADTAGFEPSGGTFRSNRTKKLVSRNLLAGASVGDFPTGNLAGPLVLPMDMSNRDVLFCCRKDKSPQNSSPFTEMANFSNHFLRDFVFFYSRRNSVSFSRPAFFVYQTHQQGGIACSLGSRRCCAGVFDFWACFSRCSGAVMFVRWDTFLTCRTAFVVSRKRYFCKTGDKFFLVCSSAYRQL